MATHSKKLSLDSGFSIRKFVRTENVQHLVRILWHVLQPHERTQLYLLIALAIAVALAEAVGVLSIVPFIAAIVEPDYVSSKIASLGLDSWPLLESLAGHSFFFPLLFFAIVTITTALNLSFGWYSQKFSNYLSAHLSTTLFAIQLYRPYSDYFHLDTSQATKQVIDDARLVCVTGILQMINLVARLFSLLIIMMLLVIIDPLLGICTLSLVSFSYAVIILRLRGWISQLARERDASNAEMYHAVATALGAIRDIKIYEAEEPFLYTFNEKANTLARSQMRSNFVASAPKRVLEWLGFLVIVGLTLFLLSFYGRQVEVLSVLGLYAFSAFRILPSMQALYYSAHMIKYIEPLLVRTEDTLSKAAPGPKIDPSGENLTFNSEIRLQNISVSYNDRGTAIHSVDLRIPKLSIVGIVGPTGCGKSTLLNVLLGLLEPDKGEIFCDDQKVQPGRGSSWFRKFGFVPQDFIILDGTVSENIAFGFQVGEIEQNRVMQAAKLAEVHDFIINDLPQGYDTMVGERGIRLSGGQKQRIAIARALYRNPEILVLDEATSALDQQNEAKIVNAIMGLRSEITIVMVSHRLSSMKNCDIIYELCDGQVKAHGKFENLVQTSKLFEQVS